MEIFIPGSVPPEKKEIYTNHYATLTKDTNRLFLFAADQKMEHLNKDFFGPDLAPEINNPEHVFTIAQKGTIGVFATHLGLISRYAEQFPTIPYCAKLDGKTNLSSGEPYSQQLWSVDDALEVAHNSGITIHAVGYTVYVGSDYERDMLTEAATIVKEAHSNGLIAILWMYPRGKEVPNPHDAHLIAGAAGLGASLGADFVKVNEPESGPQDLQEAVQAAGNTKVLVSGGKALETTTFLEKVKKQLSLGTVAGAAVGRNIFQHPLDEALRITEELAQLIYER